jgi:hypothetical protein
VGSPVGDNPADVRDAAASPGLIREPMEKVNLGIEEASRLLKAVGICSPVRLAPIRI